MKKLIVLLLCLAMALSLVACGEDKDMSGSSPTATDRKLGLGSVQSVTMTDTANAGIKTTVAAVVLDKNGKITDCKLDEMSFTVTLKEGIPQAVTEFLSKLERGDEYLPTPEELGDNKTSNRSWEDQVEAFCDFVEGKTPGEVTGLAATDGKSEQIPGCDLIITDFIQAVDHAAMAAKGAAVDRDDDLELALSAAPGEGTSQEKPAYTIEMAAVTMADDGKITACMTDTLETELSVAQGIFDTVSGMLKTKRQKGDDYGMKVASPIKREWYEQADAFDTYAVGKTASQLSATPLGADGKTDSITGCTVSVSSVLKNVVKAAKED